MRANYKKKILDKINSFDSEMAFISSDFFDIADYETVRKTLNRLTDDGVIQRIIKGIYYKPIYNKLIEEYEAASVHQVALAIARKYNWTIAPSGNTALNLLGLSTQVPAKWTYISDGRYLTITFDSISIEFKHRNNGEISKMSLESAMVIQAVKTIGKDKITEKQIKHLSMRLSSAQKEALLKDGKSASQWIFRVIREIGEGYVNVRK